MEEVITKYGKGSNVSFTENGLTLTYKTRVIDIEKNSLSDHPQEIRLGFFDPDSNGKEYYLITKSALFLDDSRYPVAAKEEFVFNWKPEDIDTLILGDRQRGKGGMTYQEVVERFGLPSYSNIHGNDTDFDPLSLSIQYINIRKSDTERKSDRVALIFRRQEDGSFCLADVSSEFDKDW